MSDTKAESPIYRALAAIKPDDLSFGAWAAKAGLARNYFTNLREHGNPKSDTLDRLLDEIGASHADLAPYLNTVGTEVRRDGTGDLRQEYWGERPLPMLPIYGTAAGGEFGDIDDHIELHELLESQVLGREKRPASLASDPDAYALTILGDSMWPRYKPLERVAVSPRAPAAMGDDVIVQLRGQEGDAERVKLVLIKELVRRTGNYVELRQFNPDRTFRVEIARVAKIHKVAGRLF